MVSFIIYSRNIYDIVCAGCTWARATPAGAIYISIIYYYISLLYIIILLLLLLLYYIYNLLRRPCLGKSHTGRSHIYIYYILLYIIIIYHYYYIIIIILLYIIYIISFAQAVPGQEPHGPDTRGPRRRCGPIRVTRTENRAREYVHTLIWATRVARERARANTQALARFCRHTVARAHARPPARPPMHTPRALPSRPCFLQ